VVVCGSNGEAATLEPDERLALVKAAREASGTVVAGTGLESTRGTIELTRRAADLGADAVLVLTPHFYANRMSPDALRRYYLAVAEAAPVPVLLYSVPVFTGIAIPPELTIELGRHSGIAGIKDSSGDVAALSRVAGGCGEGFWVASGSAPTFYPSLCAGARAGVLALACCAPEAVVALHRAFERGDHGEALRLHRLIGGLAEAVSRRYGVAGLKAAMDLAGLRGGSVRAPLLPVDDTGRRELETLLGGLRAGLG